MSSLNSLVVADWMADHPEAVDIITWTGKTFKKYLKISVSIEMFLPENFTNYLDELNLFAKAKVLLPRISKLSSKICENFKYSKCNCVPRLRELLPEPHHLRRHEHRHQERDASLLPYGLLLKTKCTVSENSPSQ